MSGIQTVRFDAGEGSEWYLVAPVVDSGDEMRSKVVKATHVTGKLTEPSIKIYTYDVDDVIDVEALESGTGSTTGALALADTAQVMQTERVQVNCPNAVLSTIRIEGDDTGEMTRDTVHEAVIELAIMGVRR